MIEIKQEGEKVIDKKWLKNKISSIKADRDSVFRNWEYNRSLEKPNKMDLELTKALRYSLDQYDIFIAHLQKIQNEQSDN